MCMPYEKRIENSMALVCSAIIFMNINKGEHPGIQWFGNWVKPILRW